MPSTGTTKTTTIEFVQHWHVYSTTPGYLPESESYTTEDPGEALDQLAHLIADWVEDWPDTNSAEFDRAGEITGRCCWCDPSPSPARDRTLAQVTIGDGLCEYLGRLCFEIAPCRERDCLKYCADAECRTVAAITDSDTWCWVCGTRYVVHDACAWLG